MHISKGVVVGGSCPYYLHHHNTLYTKINTYILYIYNKLCNKGVLSTGEPCTSKYVTLLQSFHKGTLSIQWYIAQNFQPIFYLSVLFRCLFTTAIFSRFSKVTIAMSNFMNNFYNGGFSPEFSVSMLKEIVVLVRFEILCLKRGNKKIFLQLSNWRFFPIGNCAIPGKKLN